MAAPAAPPPAPVKTSAPAPSPNQPTRIDPPSGNEPSPESYLNDDIGELTGMDEADETQKRESSNRDERGKFTKQPEKAPEKAKDKPEPENAPETPPEAEKAVEEPKPGTMRALGKAYDDLKKERDSVLQPKLQSLEAKTKEYERTIEQLKTQAPDVKPFQEKLTALEKENQQLREVVRFSDYKKSPEFTEKYEKPYNEAWSKAVGEVTQLNLQMEDGTVRKATANDLLALANAPLDQLDDLAAQWFPKSSPRVIRHVEKVKDLAEAQDKALQEAQKGAGEFIAKRTQAEQQTNQAFAQAYTGATTELTKKYSKWFAPDEADPQGNDILKKGFDYADTVFSPNGNQLTPEQKAGRLAVIRAKAANHDRLIARNKSHVARIAELEASLAEFEKSEPTTTTAGNPGRGNGVYDPMAEDEAELRKLDR
jgi:hypothetical protein